MKKSTLPSILLLLVLAATISSCSWKKIPFMSSRPAPASPSPSDSPIDSAQTPGNTIITIEAGSYSFKPNLVHVEKPGPYILQVRNVTGSEQGLTLKDPLGKVIKTLRIGAKSMTISNIELPVPGSYEFHGDKLFHTPIGIKGRIVVGAAK